MVGRRDVAEGGWSGCRLRRGAVGALVFAIAATASLPAAAHAAPTWLSPQNVFSTPVTSIQDDPFFNRKALDVVTDSGGDSVAVWIEQHPQVPGPGTECQAMYAERSPGQSFGATQSLASPIASCGTSGQINAAMNATGTTVVAWKQGTDIVAAIRSPGGTFAAPTTLSASTATDDPWVSINDAGVAAVTWDDTNTGSCPGLTSGTNWAFHASVRQPGGGFGPFETVCDVHPSPGSGPTIFTPRNLVDPQGDVVATWVNSFNDGTHAHFDVESAYRAAGGSFTGTTPQVLSDMIDPPGGAGTFAADIAVDTQGRATAVWPFLSAGKTVIQTAVRPSGTSAVFGPPGAVSDPMAAGNANSPRVAVDPASNTAVAVWVQCPTASNCQVESASRPSGGGFAAPQTLSAPGATTSFGPLVAFDPSGDATAIWSGPSPDISGTQVQVATRPAGTGQSFGAVTTISNADPSKSPAIAFDGEGNAIAVWDHDTTSPTGAILQYAGFDAAPPDIQAVSAPNGTAGTPISFSATAVDRWSTPSLSWSFSDGGTATGAAVSHTFANPGSYQVTITAQDAVGNASSQSATVVVSAPPVPPVITPPSPALSKLALKPSSFRAAARGATIARGTPRRRRPPIGTTVSYRDSLGATTTFTVLRRAVGMVKGRSCVKLSRRARHPRRCTRYVKVGSFRHMDKAGAVKFTFTGRLGGHALAVGRYQLSAIARSGRLHSKTLSVRFRVVR